MDIEILLKLLQDWTNRVPLVILGSGASVPFHLPSMWTLGDHLKKTISFADPDDQRQFDEFKAIFDEVQDIELTLLQLQLRPNVLSSIIFETWKLVSKHDLEAYDQFLNNKTDFPLAELTSYLLSSAQRKLSVITTNYDRLAEYAASLSNAFICTGYSQNFIGHFSNSIHHNNLSTLKGYSGHVNIWKVHGSLDWFKTKDEYDIQLPLRHTIPAECKPSIVTPGVSKYLETQLEPFRTIFTEADNEIENAIGYLCVGYGFNDIH
ncbi:MAG: SIR2 family protein, partial [Bacteroidetes bacterium]|nr:SIR2 family protein [Bacteroidota bacterium]